MQSPLLLTEHLVYSLHAVLAGQPIRAAAKRPLPAGLLPIVNMVI